MIILLRVRGCGWVSLFLLHAFDGEEGICLFMYVCVLLGGVHSSKTGMTSVSNPGHSVPHASSQQVTGLGLRLVSEIRIFFHFPRRC